MEIYQETHTSLPCNDAPDLIKINVFVGSDQVGAPMSWKGSHEII